MRLGFIGFGKFAKLRLRCVSEITGIVPVGFFDPGAPRASELPRYAAVKELLSVVDAVLV